MISVPLHAKDLPDPVNIIPTGLFAEYIGRQYLLDELRDTETYSVENEPYLPRIRAFAVPSLTGRHLTIQRDTELQHNISNLFKTVFENIKWDFSNISLAPLRKYFLFHGCIPAPRDTATNQEMVLEFYGEMLRFDGLPLDSEVGIELKYQHIERYIQASRENLPEPELSGEMVLEIRSATYSNVQYLGLGVPLYM